MKSLISGSIVIFKNDISIRKSIESFLNTSLPVTLFLIDNSPTEQIKDFICDLLGDKRVEYIYNNKNIGYGAGHNIAMRRAIGRSPYHLILNPDVYFDDRVLKKLFMFLEENNDVGLVIPKVVYPDGHLQYLCKLLPTPMDLIFRRFLPNSIIQRRLYDYEMRFSEYSRKMEVPYISGCFMLMRTSVISKVGFFDERFFLYLEDTDLSRRFFAESKNVYFPDAQIIHKHKRGSYKNLRLLIIHIRSAIQYFNKWGWFFDKQRTIINKRVKENIQKFTVKEEGVYVIKTLEK